MLQTNPSRMRLQVLHRGFHQGTRLDANLCSTTEGVDRGVIDAASNSQLVKQTARSPLNGGERLVLNIYEELVALTDFLNHFTLQIPVFQANFIRPWGHHDLSGTTTFQSLRTSTYLNHPTGWIFIFFMRSVSIPVFRQHLESVYNVVHVVFLNHIWQPLRSSLHKISVRKIINRASVPVL